jgi:hypothetical protein
MKHQMRGATQAQQGMTKVPRFRVTPCPTCPRSFSKFNGHPTCPRALVNLMPSHLLVPWFHEQFFFFFFFAQNLFTWLQKKVWCKILQKEILENWHKVAIFQEK